MASGSSGSGAGAGSVWGDGVGSAGEQDGEAFGSECGLEAIGEGEGDVLFEGVFSDAGAEVGAAVGGVEDDGVEVEERLIGSGGGARPGFDDRDGDVVGGRRGLGVEGRADEQQGKTSGWRAKDHVRRVGSIVSGAGWDFLAEGTVGLVEGVDGQSAEELGVEVGGLLGHDVAGKRDVVELLESDGPDEEGDVGVSGLNLGNGFLGVAEIADVFEVGDGLVGEAEKVLEHDAVELDDVELGLAIGDPGVKRLENDLDGFFFGGEEVGGVFGDGEKGYAFGFCEKGEVRGCDLRGCRRRRRLQGGKRRGHRE